jgi:methionine biosynthesis protein MetW
MRLTEYVRRYDSLTSEAALYDIPARKEYLLKEIGRGKRVLDLGCLGGRISRLIKDQNNDVYGVEVNARAAEQAEKRGIRVKQFDLNDGIPFEDGFFDVINACEIIEHIYDTKYLLEECHRVLKPDGVLILTTPNLNSLKNRIKVLLGGYPALLGAFPEDHFGEHIRVFNLDKIHELADHVGFSVAHAQGIAGLTRRSLQYRLFAPLVRLRPSLGELLVVKLRRLSET